MNLKKVLIFFMSTIGFLSAAYGGEAEDCALEKYRAYSSAQEKWQRETAGIVKKAKPGLGDVAELYMKDQLVLIEKNRLAVERLLTLKPDRIPTSLPPNRWLRDFSPEDEEYLIQSSKPYAGLFRKAEAIKKRPPHPDGDALRAAMRTEIINLPEYQQSFSRFMEAVGGVESRACPNE